MFYDALISKTCLQEAGALLTNKPANHLGRQWFLIFDPQVVQAFLAVEHQFVKIAATYKDGKNVVVNLSEKASLHSLHNPFKKH
ncbi:hypothetical protein O9993_08810 [Vibrio lentus]|nr:hypothetical protein [Vibrio lentus]